MTADWHKVSFGGMEMFRNLTVATAADSCGYTRDR